MDRVRGRCAVAHDTGSLADAGLLAVVRSAWPIPKPDPATETVAAAGGTRRFVATTDRGRRANRRKRVGRHRQDHPAHPDSQRAPVRPGIAATGQTESVDQGSVSRRADHHAKHRTRRAGYVRSLRAPDDPLHRLHWGPRDRHQDVAQGDRAQSGRRAEFLCGRGSASQDRGTVPPQGICQDPSHHRFKEIVPKIAASYSTLERVRGSRIWSVTFTGNDESVAPDGPFENADRIEAGHSESVWRHGRSRQDRRRHRKADGLLPRIWVTFAPASDGESSTTKTRSGSRSITSSTKVRGTLCETSPLSATRSSRPINSSKHCSSIPATISTWTA